MSSGGRASLVCWGHAVCASCPLLCLPVFPHCSSPPARLTDRQMLSAMHLQLWASITLCLHTGCKFRLPLLLQIRANITDRTYFMYEMQLTTSSQALGLFKQMILISILSARSSDIVLRLFFLFVPSILTTAFKVAPVSCLNSWLF